MDLNIVCRLCNTPLFLSVCLFARARACVCVYVCMRACVRAYLCVFV